MTLTTPRTLTRGPVLPCDAVKRAHRPTLPTRGQAGKIREASVNMSQSVRDVRLSYAQLMMG